MSLESDFSLEVHSLRLDVICVHEAPGVICQMMCVECMFWGKTGLHGSQNPGPGPQQLQGCLGDGVGVGQGPEPAQSRCLSEPWFLWKMKGVKHTLQFVLKTKARTQRPMLAHNKGSVKS